ncbi:MAG TPA: hypothetical protein VF784_03830 [Anaerolineales bacterium]
MSRSVILRRIGWSMLAGLLIGVVVSELSFYLLDNGTTRPPKLVQIDIPPGTAVRVARGQGNASLPSSLTFVIGDTMLVTNHDSVAHQLGPLFIPAGGSASMHLASEQGYNLLCSFQPSKYLQLSVLPPLTLTTRIDGILEAGLNVGFLIAVYAVFALPAPKKRAA